MLTSPLCESSHAHLLQNMPRQSKNPVLCCWHNANCPLLWATNEACVWRSRFISPCTWAASSSRRKARCSLTERNYTWKSIKAASEFCFFKRERAAHMRVEKIQFRRAREQWQAAVHATCLYTCQNYCCYTRVTRRSTQIYTTRRLQCEQDARIVSPDVIYFAQ